MTHIKKFIGIKSVREIEENTHRRAESQYSNIFHGRYIYAYTGAKLASGKITFEEVGQENPVDEIVEIEVGEVVKTENSIMGNIDILDVRFGSLWTNISIEDFLAMGFEYNEKIEVIIKNGSTIAYNNRITFGKSFADVHVSEQIIYINSLLRIAVAINQGNFAKAYNIGTGLHWTIEFIKVK